MSAAIPLAFYAPLKSPDHPVPSGDRTMARLLLSALAAAGYAPRVASRSRSFEPAGDEGRQREIRVEGARETARLLAEFASWPADARPRLWFTYHAYYKAPDWIGPEIARALAIPYVAAEASRAGKRASGPWAMGHHAVEAALDLASTIFVLTGADREALERARPPEQRLVALPPFIDLSDWPESQVRARRMTDRGEPIRLITVAMMRDGDKLDSYRRLAGALSGLSDGNWRLDVVGDGPARASVEAMLAPLGDRVSLHGRIDDRARLAPLYAGADLLVWPAVNEAYGMVLLEAQAMGCPVLAGGYGGVADAMQPGITGVMTPPEDAEAFATALAGLVREPGRLRGMSEAARHFVRDERHLAGAARILRDGLGSALAGSARRCV